MPISICFFNSNHFRFLFYLPFHCLFIIVNSLEINFCICVSMLPQRHYPPFPYYIIYYDKNRRKKKQKSESYLYGFAILLLFNLSSLDRHSYFNEFLLG